MDSYSLKVKTAASPYEYFTHLKKDSTVLDLKKDIHAHFLSNPDVSDQRIIFHGRMLEEQMQLSDVFGDDVCSFSCLFPFCFLVVPSYLMIWLLSLQMQQQHVVHVALKAKASMALQAALDLREVSVSRNRLILFALLIFSV